MINIKNWLMRISDWSTIRLFIICTGTYVLLFGRYYFSGEIVHGSDTHGVWSLPYLTFYSIKEFGEFPWWDPTGLNGWPIYSYLLNWSFNYFNPFSLMYLLLFKAISMFVNITPTGINTAIVFQKTLYYFLLNLIAILLISREVLVNKIARALPALMFTLSVVQFQGFRDSHQFEALPGPLFYLFALIYCDKRRTFRSVLVLILFAGLFLSSSSYAVTSSALYWTVLFTGFLLVVHPSLVPAVFRVLKDAWSTRARRLAIVFGILFVILALAAPVSSVALNVGNLLRITGSQPLDYRVGMFGDWKPPHFGVPVYEIWTNLMYFAPFFELHDTVLKFDPYKAGMDHRYVGLVTIPLLFAALILGFRHRYLIVFFLTFFVCTAFITYTIANVAFAALMKLPPFQNVRVMGGFLPRDGGALLLIFMAAIGFDRLLSIGKENGNSTVALGEDSTEGRWLKYTLVGCFAAMMVAAMGSVALVVLSPVAPLRHTFAHIGVYLGLFSLLCLLLLIVEDAGSKKLLSIVLLVLVFTDLTVSASDYFLRRPGYMVYRNEGSWTKPAPEAIGPITEESQNWPGRYRGIFHNLAGGPFVGTREWLVLATRPKMATLLENWDMKALTMRSYPHFRVFTNGRFIPFKRIKEIDSVDVPERPGAWFYLHDAELVKSRLEPGTSIDVDWRILDFTLNRVRVAGFVPQDGFMVYYDNFNKWFRARVDGREVRIYRANFTFKAIEVPAGEHIIEWVFDPYPVKIAWSLFYASFFAYGLLMWRCFANPPSGSLTWLPSWRKHKT